MRSTAVNALRGHRRDRYSTEEAGCRHCDRAAEKPAATDAGVDDVLNVRIAGSIRTALVFVADSRRGSELLVHCRLLGGYEEKGVTEIYRPDVTGLRQR